MDARTCRVYFLGVDKLDNLNWVHYLKVTGTPSSLITGLPIPFETGKNYAAFGKNVEVNAVPAVSLVDIISDNKIKVTVSERVFKAGGSPTQVDSTSFVIRNVEADVTLVPNVDFTVVQPTDSMLLNKVFYIVLNDGAKFVEDGSYRVGLSESVYGIDQIVKAEVYNPEVNEAGASISFSGMGILAKPMVSYFDFDLATKTLASGLDIDQNYYKALEIYVGLAAPSSMTNAEYVFDLTATDLLSGVQNNLVILPGATAVSGDLVYFRYVDRLGNKSEWAVDEVL